MFYLLFLELRNSDQKLPFMSFKLFIASTFGLLKATAKIEKEQEALRNDYKNYLEFEQSPEYNEFLDLETLVNSATFKLKKKELQKLSLKGSKEESMLNEFRKLNQSGRLKRYFQTLKSPELERFENIQSSGLPNDFIKLKSLVTGSSFDRKKAKDNTSDEFEKFTQYQKLKDSSDLQFANKFSSSPAYKNYLRIKDSSELKRLNELQEITSAEDFRNRVNYLEDKQKWQKTEEAAKEIRYTELLKTPLVVNFLKYRNSHAFDFHKKWDLVFEDRFDSKKLDETKWTTLSYWAKQTLGKNFSQMGDYHTFTDGQNILTDGKSLQIEVRKEKAKGMQWLIPFGFVEKEFEYTSGLITTAESDWWNHGILEAKVKYSGSPDFVDAIYLLGEESSPQINLLEMGAKNRVGTFTKTDQGIKSSSESISGLKEGEFYIFRLEWSAQSLVWKINNREILSINLHIPSHSMHLNIASIIVNEKSNRLPHRFEIDWVRFYKHHIS